MDIYFIYRKSIYYIEFSIIKIKDQYLISVLIFVDWENKGKLFLQKSEISNESFWWISTPQCSFQRKINLITLNFQLKLKTNKLIGAFQVYVNSDILHTTCKILKCETKVSKNCNNTNQISLQPYRVSTEQCRRKIRISLELSMTS